MSLNLLEQLALAIAIAAMALALWRLLLGPDTANRLVATDTLTVITTALLALLAVLLDSYWMLDVILMFAALGFVGTVVLARLLEND